MNDRWTVISEDVEYGFENISELGGLMSLFDKAEKIKTYDLLSQGYTLTEISENVGIAVSTVHGYKESFEDQGLIYCKGTLTEEGEFVHSNLQELDEEYGQFLYQQALDQLGIDEDDLDSIDGTELPE